MLISASIRLMVFSPAIKEGDDHFPLKESKDSSCKAIKKGEIMRYIKSWYFILITRKKEVGKLHIFMAFFLIAGAFGGQAIGGEFVDYGTQYLIKVRFADFLGEGPLSIHICTGYSYMTGVHVKDNRFLCDDYVAVYPPSALTTNEAPGQLQRYQSHGMAACPPGKAMVGLHAARNVLLCAPLQTTNLFIDADTQREGMHACPKGSVLVGIHDDRNLLLCGSNR